jgi:hypothetical protein
MTTLAEPFTSKGDKMAESSFQIRKFSSFEEIENLSGFHAENPITKENYDQLLGHYDLKIKLKCCRKTAKSLCHTSHKFGFVARLKDSSVSIVGNVCAEERFGIDTDIAKHAKAYHQEKARQEKLERVRELLNDESKHMQALEVLTQELCSAERKISSILDQLPQAILENLKTRAKTRNTEVVVTSITHHQHIDELGNVEHETRKTPTTLGNLKGLSALDAHIVFRIKKSISNIKTAYKEAHRLDENARSSDLVSISTRIAEISNVNSSHQVFMKGLKSFFQTEPLLFCYLVNNKSDRFKVAKMALELSGKSVSRGKAKAWLLDQDHKLKSNLKADSITIQE